MWFRQVSGAAAARLGYVNPGPDRRLGGALGRLLGQTQRELSFKSATPPIRAKVERFPSGTLLEVTRSVPYDREHITLAIPRGRGRWATVRCGWRWDPNWGDARTIGYNPQPEIVGGYIADVVIKLNAERSFIDDGTT